MSAIPLSGKKKIKGPNVYTNMQFFYVFSKRSKWNRNIPSILQFTVFSELQNGKKSKNIVMNGVCVGKSRKIFHRKMWAVYRNTGHKCIHILLLQQYKPLAETDLFSVKGYPELQGLNTAKIKIRIMNVFLWIPSDVTCLVYVQKVFASSTKYSLDFQKKKSSVSCTKSMKFSIDIHVGKLVTPILSDANYSYKNTCSMICK